MQTVNFDMVSGDDFLQTIQFKNGDVPIDITSWTNPKAQIKDLDGNVIGEFTFADVTPANGIATLSLAASITANLVGAYIWDFQRTDSESKVKTVMGGYLNVASDVSALA